MNRMKKIYALLAVLAVCCAAAWMAVHTQQEQESIKEEGQTILSLDTDAVTALSWQYDDTLLTFEKTDGEWKYTRDENFPVDGEEIESLISHFADFASVFTIESPRDIGQYGLDEPMCTIQLTEGENSYTVSLGDYSTMDMLRYVSIGDGNVYLAASDLWLYFEKEADDLMKNDSAPAADSVKSLSADGETPVSFVLDENGSSPCRDDVYFADVNGGTKPLDTDNVTDFLSMMENLSLTDYITYNAREEDFVRAGLDSPAHSISLVYDEEGEEKTFTLNLSSSGEGDDAVYYANVSGSKIIYKITQQQYEDLAAHGYDDLRHKEIFTADFDSVTGADVTIDGESYTLTMGENDDGQQSVFCGENQRTAEDFSSALTGISARDFAPVTEYGKQEISLTIHTDSEEYPRTTLEFYRYDNEHCVAFADGEFFALVDRARVVDLMERVNAVVL